MSRSKPRLLLYSHDTYGLGHLRRTLAIAHQVAADLPDAHQLLITGSMVAGAFSLPPRLDMIKLPALSKRSSGQYTARALPLSLGDTLSWRKHMILQAATAFKPDLVLVDKSPAGVQGELLPTLRHLRAWAPTTQLVLGMRDIEDDPEVTLAEWRRADVPRLQTEIYDHLLYYGQRSVFDPVTAYRMSARAASKLVECGYLARPVADADRPAAVVRRELGAGALPLVVVTVGGGGDGFDVVRAYLEMLAEWPGGAPFYSLVVTGPLMSAGKRRLLRQAARTERLTLLDFTPALFSYLAAADLVIGMAGYNTVCETLALGRRAIFIPRVHPRGEQRLRAERLAALGLARLILPVALTPARLAAEVQDALAETPPAGALQLDGLARVSRALAELLGQPLPAAALPDTAFAAVEQVTA